MMPETLRIRRAASADDVGQSAEVCLAARHANRTTIPALVHTDDEVRRWFHEVVMPERDLWVAEAGGVVVGVLVLDGPELDQLYVAPGETSNGIGRALLDHAKARRPDGLALWVFESNVGARRFYEREGFVEVDRTDGSGNEEHAPDVRCAWPTRPGVT